MAPGPQVDILKDKPISFENVQSKNNTNFDEDDEDFVAYKYYPSSKILGKLFSAIDEPEIFRRVQQNRLQQSFQKNWASNPTRSVLEGIWNYVEGHYTLINWKDHLDWARGIRDE
jgi:hypothetical protein